MDCAAGEAARRWRQALYAALSVLVLGACAQSDTAVAEDADAGADAPATAAARAETGVVARGLPRNMLHLQPAAIIDATGFEQPMAAATLFVPYGWQMQGGVYWGSDAMCTNGYVFNWRAQSPDGRSGIAVLPQERWETNNYGAPPSTPGCRPGPWTNLRQYLETVARRLRGDARLLDYRSRPDLQRQFAQFNRQVPMPMGELRSWVEAGEIHYGYVDRGVEMRGLVAAVAVLNLQRTNAGTGMIMDAFSAGVFPMFAAHAPSAGFNAAYFEGLRRSIKSDPRWDQRITGHNVAIARVALEESRKRAEMIMRSNAEIARIRSEAWSAYQESADRRAREFGEVIRGVETYDDANAPGGRVELSAQYSHAWRLNDGSYVMTDDPGFEPWRDLRLEGRRLEATR